jgi:hypothetical protein
MILSENQLAGNMFSDKNFFFPGNIKKWRYNKQPCLKNIIYYASHPPAATVHDFFLWQAKLPGCIVPERACVIN